MATQALFFDVFGTLADWRTSIAREAQALLGPLGHTLDWLAFAGAWRGEEPPRLCEARAGVDRHYLADGRSPPPQRTAVGRDPRRRDRRRLQAEAARLSRRRRRVR